jgi:hypothetical protein
MFEAQWIKRPTCEEILTQSDSWAIKIDDLREDFLFKKFMSAPQKENDEFYKIFLLTKLNFYEKNS